MSGQLSDPAFPPLRARAKKACKACNARRVRCNVADTWPCRNCHAATIECEFRASRRGKYIRQRHLSLAGNQGLQTDNGAASQNLPINRETELADLIYDRNAASLRHSSLENSIIDSTVPTPHGSLGNEHVRRSRSLCSTGVSPSTETRNSTVRGAGSTVFLGESSSMSCVRRAQNTSASEHPTPSDDSKLRYRVADARPALWNACSPAKMELLKQESIWNMPSAEVCDKIVCAYFTWFHPCFPIINRTALASSYADGTTSPLLLQAMLFVGAGYCDDETLQRLDTKPRHAVRHALYTRAKDIYDSDYEADKYIVLQALFLMSFWRAGPLQEKDTRHWLGAAISLAQTKGMHRSSPNFDVNEKRARKKIWWSIYVRDRQCASALGLPIRIRDEDCDVEELDVTDFDVQSLPHETGIFGTQTIDHVHYAVQTVKLAKLLGQIILTEFSPNIDGKSHSHRPKIHEDLVKWERELPSQMVHSVTSDGSPRMWASMLHATYNNLYILLYRSTYLNPQGHSHEGKGHEAFQAACRNTRIVEYLLSNDLVQYAQVHFITSVFNSLCIHTVNLRRSKGTARKLAVHRSQLCLLGLKELQRTWDIRNWVLEIFLQFLDASTAKTLSFVDDEDASLVAQSTSRDQTRGQAQHQPGPRQEHSGEEMMPANMEPQSFSQLLNDSQMEDFSMYQLCPDLFSGDFFGGDIAAYYNYTMPSRDGLSTADVSYLARCL